MRIDALLMPKAVRETRCLLTRRELGFVGSEFRESRPIPLSVYQCWYVVSMRFFHWALFVFTVVGTAMLVARPSHLTWPLTRIIGACLLALVFAWIGIARFQLGSAFSLTPKARQLVTTGIYSRIRNPIYVASPFLLVGLSLVLGLWWPLLLFVAVIPVQIARARREASVLRAAFGPEYDRYSAKTWF